MRLRPPVGESDFKAASHSAGVTARIGLWLGVCFAVCFVTGLLSHAIQHPPSWFWWPSRPAQLYRVTQGLHVVTGIAAIPLLIAKVWTVYPKLFGWPPVRSPAHALERLSIFVLSASAFFQLATGLFNVAQNYPWNFYFPGLHYAVAWVAVGSIVVHVAVKLPVVRSALGEKPADDGPSGGGLSRRGFLRATGLATGVAVVATAGATVPLLRKVSALSWQSGPAPQKLPVNKTAAGAGVQLSAQDPRWRLTVTTGHGTRTFTRDQLKRLPQTDAELPIACVEGWSQQARWRGVALPDLLHAVGARPGDEVHVQSLQKKGAYTLTTLPGEHTADPSTLLALELNGQTLSLDHGYPCRIIAPNRPGVLQTKWVDSLEVR